MKTEYQIEKWIWNQDDFEQMGWHDCPIWAMSFDDDVKFDLDYIFKWVHPEDGRSSFRFWISPATLIFKNPSNFNVAMETNFVNGLEIADILKEVSEGKTSYIIEGQEGRIKIQTEEFVQIIRRPPTLQISQALSEIERGPLSFSEEAEKEYIPSTKELKMRKLSYEFDDLRTMKIKLEINYDEFNFDKLNPKERMLKKREFKSKIEQMTELVNKAEKKMKKAYEE
jgi:hypothetical protein